MIGRRFIPLAAFIVASVAAARGQVPASSPAPIVPHTPDGTYQLLIYFLLIVALLVGGLWFARNGFVRPHGKSKGDRKLVISETRTLGNRQFLVVAEYENRKMLLGVCPGRIDYLTTLVGDETFSTELPEKAE